jgi:uncharacterized tellurite resistance protein B-like protein
VGNTFIVETQSGTASFDSQLVVATLMIFVAKGSGRIEPEESAEMIDLIEEHFGVEGAESLALLTRAMTEMVERPDLEQLLAEFGKLLPDSEKEEIAVMALKVIAADGRREVAEIENFNVAVETLGISPEIKHRAFDRYFQQTMPGE